MPSSNQPQAQAVISLRDALVHSISDSQDLLQIPKLDLFPGERVVITGASGSGKSLLLSTLTGRWAAGLRFSGTRISRTPRIGVVPQRGLDALHPLLPLAKQLRKVTGASAVEVANMLNTVGLDAKRLGKRRPAELSGGQAQRASIALVVLTRAPLILADEPTSALDHASRDQTLELLATVIDAEQTLVVVTHDPEVAAALATRRLSIRGGEITESVAPNSPYSRTQAQATRQELTR